MAKIEVNSMRTSGAILPSDWKLFLCATQSGTEGLLSWGNEQAARQALANESKRGFDVWLVAPTGEKILPAKIC